MGMTAQRRWRQKKGLEPVTAPSPAPLPLLVPRHEHDLAIQELTISYEARLRSLSEGTPDEAKAAFTELTEKVESLEAENAELRQRVTDLESQLAYIEEESADGDNSQEDGDGAPDGAQDSEQAAVPKPPKKKPKKPKTTDGDSSPEV